MTRHLLVGACGAGNVLNLPAYIHALRQNSKFDVQVIMTRTAASILPSASVRLTCDAVFCDGADCFDPGHAGLAAWADQMIMLPATAHMLGQVATGLAGNLLASAALAFDKPIVFFPSMNELMWKHPAVRRNVARMREDGHHVIDPRPVRTWEIASRSLTTRVGLPDPPDVADIVQRFATGEQR